MQLDRPHVFTSAIYQRTFPLNYIDSVAHYIDHSFILFSFSNTRFFSGESRRQQLQEFSKSIAVFSNLALLALKRVHGSGGSVM